MAHLLCCHSTEQVLEFDCFGGGKWRGELPALIAIIHCADHAGGPPHGLPDRFEEVCRGRLSASAGHANQREPSAGTLRETVGHEAEKQTRIVTDNGCHPCR